MARSAESAWAFIVSETYSTPRPCAGAFSCSEADTVSNARTRGRGGDVPQQPLPADLAPAQADLEAAPTRGSPSSRLAEFGLEQSPARREFLNRDQAFDGGEVESVREPVARQQPELGLRAENFLVVAPVGVLNFGWRSWFWQPSNTP